jgi:hypothetical protein
VPLGCMSQVSPPSVVRRMVPLPPTADPLIEHRVYSGDTNNVFTRKC